MSDLVHDQLLIIIQFNIIAIKKRCDCTEEILISLNTGTEDNINHAIYTRIRVIFSISQTDRRTSLPFNSRTLPQLRFSKRKL